jgi:hypothetical protein
MAKATVVVTPALQGNCLNVSPAAFLPIGDIIITEGANGDFPTQTNTTLILSAPAGFMFQPGSGNVSFTASRNITAATLNVTLTTITVTLIVSGTNKADALNISGVMARATGTDLTGNIIRKNPGGGTAVITGNAAGAGINHATLSSIGSGMVITSVSNGNWSAPTTWSGGVVPFCNDKVVIQHQVTVDIASPELQTLTIRSNAKLIANMPVTVNGNFVMESNSCYVHNNNSIASATIFKGTEAIDDQSVIEINNWSSAATPLMSGVNGSVGHLILNYNAVWQQNGLFAPSNIKGDLTVTNGQVIMDNGTGMTTLLNLNHVSIYKNGSVIFTRGTNRNFTLNTLSFTDSSKSSALTALMYQCYGTLTWNNNGNVYLKHDFSGIEGTAGTNPANANITIGGSLTTAGGKIDFLKYINGSANIQITGNTYCQLNPGSWFHLANYNAVNISFTTANLLINGTENNFLQGSGGSSDFLVNGNFSYSGSGLFVFTNSLLNSAPQNIQVLNNFSVTNGSLGCAFSSGIVSVYVANNLVVNGSTTQMVAQFYPYSTANVDVTIERNCLLTDGSFDVTWNRGKTNFTVNGIYKQINAEFQAVFHPFYGNFESCNVNIDSLYYEGGVFHVFNSYITDSKLVTFNIGSVADINFQQATDRFILITNASGSNNPMLNMNVNGNLFIRGNNNGLFATSMSSGLEQITLMDSLIVDGGTTTFGGSLMYVTNPHPVNISIHGSVIQTNGQFNYSVQTGNVNAVINGDLILNNGIQNLTNADAAMMMTLNGNFYQTGGVLNFHAFNTGTLYPDSFMVGGKFIQTNGSLSFDAAQGSANLAQNVLVLNADSVILDGSGIISHNNHLTNNTVFGKIVFAKNGTTYYQRNSSAHDLRQVMMSVEPLTTLDVSSSLWPMQISSHASALSTIHNTLTIKGVLNMGLQRISARQQSGYYAQVSVTATGGIRTMNPNGFYSVSAASTLDPFISGLNRMNFWLDPLSTIEYNGVSTQKVTGVPNGIASNSTNKYGKLQINLNGIADVDYVRPEYDSAVFVRSALLLTNGEFNLNQNHAYPGNGLSIVLENGCQIYRAAGYLRSEAINGASAVHWQLSGASIYEIPFGFNSTSYIPFQYQCTSNCSGTVTFATYHSNPDNTPYPPTVTHVNSISGTDNSSQTVDRYWCIKGNSNANANLDFSFTPAEKGSIATPRAQRWLSNNAWEFFQGLQSNPSPFRTQVTGISQTNTWWTLSNLLSPLPVSLLSFNATCTGGVVHLEWTTASQLNNDIFIIERSGDGKNWENLTAVKGAGTTNKLVDYHVTDESPLSQMSYYRLSQIDYDGSRNNIKTIGLKGCISDPIQLLYYTFTDHKMNIKIKSSYSDKLEIFLFNEKGQLMARKLQNINSSISDIEMDTQIAKGVYLLSIRSSYFNISKKLVKD